MKTGLHINASCLVGLLLAGCMVGSNRPGPAQPLDSDDVYTLSESSAESESGCRFIYRQYRPLQPETTTTVILGHGFLRDQNKLIDLSRELANAGIPVATLNFCNMRLWNGHHARNAQDMRTLAISLGASDDVIYAGFSAGALAALLAADEQTRAVLTLDLVDQAGLGLLAAQRLKAPLLGLHGPSHRCNANNNALEVFAANLAKDDNTNSMSTLIANASHCEFESPSNWLCERACGDTGSTEANTQTRQAVMQATLELIGPHLSPLSLRQVPES